MTAQPLSALSFVDKVLKKWKYSMDDADFLRVTAVLMEDLRALQGRSAVKRLTTFFAAAREVKSRAK